MSVYMLDRYDPARIVSAAARRWVSLTGRETALGKAHELTGEIERRLVLGVGAPESRKIIGPLLKFLEQVPCLAVLPSPGPPAGLVEE